MFEIKCLKMIFLILKTKNILKYSKKVGVKSKIILLNF